MLGGFDTHSAHADYHDRQRQAMEAQRQRLMDADLLGVEFSVSAHLSPGDTLSLARVGPKGSPASYISVVAEEHGQRVSLSLNARSARLLAAALLNRADELDPPAPADQMDHSGADRMGGKQ